MPTRAKIYAHTVVAAGAITLALAAALWSCQSPIRFLACLFLALLASTFKVKLPGMEGCITPSFVPLLFSVGTMTWQESVVMAAAAGFMQTLWRAQKPPMPIQVLFNGANLVLSMGSAFAISEALAGHQLLVRLAIAVVVFETLNTLFVSMVVRLITGDPLAGVWRNCHLWTFPYHLCGAVLAVVWIQSDLAMGLSLGVLGALTLYLMSTFYQELVRRTAPGERLST